MPERDKRMAKAERACEAARRARPQEDPACVAAAIAVHGQIVAGGSC